MESNGAFLSSGGFTGQKWEEVGKIYGIKILRKKTIGNEKQSLPPLSNAPGTAYILLDHDGNFKQYRQYGEDRKPEFDIDYGKHNGEISLHKHLYKKSKGRESDNVTIIANSSGILEPDLYNEYEKFLKGIELWKK